MAKPGPKPKIGPTERKQIITAVGIGGSLADAAGAIGVSVKTVQNAMRADPQFFAGVVKARKAGKLKLIRKVQSARAWQAAAWMLERQYGAEYGRKVRTDVTSGGKPIGQAPDDIIRLIVGDPSTAELANALARRVAGHARGDGESAN